MEQDCKNYNSCRLPVQKCNKRCEYYNKDLPDLSQKNKIEVGLIKGSDGIWLEFGGHTVIHIDTILPAGGGYIVNKIRGYIISQFIKK